MDGPDGRPEAHGAISTARAGVAEPEGPYEWKRFGLSLGLQLIAEVDTTLRVDSRRSGNLSAEAEYDYIGLMGYLRVF